MVAVHLSSHPINEEEHEEGAAALLKLLNEASTLLGAIHEEETVTSYNSIYALTRIAKLVEEATSPICVSAVLYLAFCKFFKIRPRIVSEFALFPEKGQRKKVCVLGERCY